MKRGVSMRATSRLVVTTETEAMPTLRPRSMTKARPFQVVTESGYSSFAVARPFSLVSRAGIHSAVSAKNSRTETGAMGTPGPRAAVASARGMLAAKLASAPDISPMVADFPNAPVTTTDCGLLFRASIPLPLISRLLMKRPPPRP
jgi:hypothetical protein